MVQRNSKDNGKMNMVFNIWMHMLPQLHSVKQKSVLTPFLQSKTRY